MLSPSTKLRVNSAERRRSTQHGSFQIFHQFPELRIGIFGKPSTLKGDAACAREIGFAEVACLNQVHGNVTHVVDHAVNPLPEGDGLVTKTPHLALSIRWADCQAFLVYAPKARVIGVLHVGWRGMASRAITAHFQCLQANFGIEPAETYVGAAPSLCKNCTDFTDPLHELPSHLHPFIEGKCVDLQAAADAEFDSLGIPREQRERHPACTRCGEACLPPACRQGRDRQGFWSWRRDKIVDARNYLVAGLRMS